MRNRSLVAAATVLAAALSATACNSDANGPDGTGDGLARAFIKDNPSSTSASQASPVSFSISGGSGTSAYTGTIEGTVTVAVSADGQVWYNLNSAQAVSVEAQATNDSSSVGGEAEVPAGTYNRVRVTFQNSVARINAGSSIGGITLAIDAVVAIGGANAQVVVEKQVSEFRISATATTATVIVADLNSESWITESNIAAQAIGESDIQSAVDVAVRASASGGVE